MACAKLGDTEAGDDLKNAELMRSRPATPMAKTKLLLENLLGKMTDLARSQRDIDRPGRRKCLIVKIGPDLMPCLHLFMTLFWNHSLAPMSLDYSQSEVVLMNSRPEADSNKISTR